MIRHLLNSWRGLYQRRAFRHILRRGATAGFCSICERPVFFYQTGDWLRDDWRCPRCFSIPRWRALIQVLETHFPEWRQKAIHESSPGGPSSKKLANECQNYVCSHFYSDVTPGEYKGQCRCENLESQTFPDNSFDLVITQDVFEHIMNPANAFREVARVLKPGGAHVFTIPWYYWKPTLVRAKFAEGRVVHLEPPDYHGNPIDASGSLVVTEWGAEFCDFILQASGLGTTAVRIDDRSRGIGGKFIEVFISRKPG